MNESSFVPEPKSTLPSVTPISDQALQSDTEALLRELKQTSQRKMRMNRWFRPVYLVSTIYYLVYMFVVMLLHCAPPHAFALPLEILHNLALFTMLSGTLTEVVFHKRITKTRVRLAGIVHQLGQNPRAAGALAQLCLPTHLVSYSEIALEPLIRLLPAIELSDAPYITDSQMEAFLALLGQHPQLSEPRWKDLRLTLLKTLERIGDSRAIEPVRRLTIGDRNRPYHQAARECLAILEQQGEQRSYQRTLLMPASQAQGAETLLRPLAPHEETEPTLLLRAADREEQP